MNKAQLVEAVANEAEVSKADTERVINTLVHTIKEHVRKGMKVPVTGLGTFEITERAARMGVNPATGAKIQIAAKKAPKFKAAKAFKDHVM